MSDRRGPFISDTPDVELAPKSPDAPTTASDIMGAHWTVDRQDIVGQDKVERDKYGQIAAEIDAHDGVSALQSILMPRHGTPDLIGGSTSYDKDAIWRDVQRIRQTNPDFLSSTPARNATEFDAWLLKRSKDQRAAAQSVITRQSGLGQNVLGFGTDLVAGFTDPINLATLPIGGGGKTLLQTMGREALVNGLTEAAELPLVAHHRAQLGEDMTPLDMAADVGMAAVGGAVLPGVLHGAGKAASAAGKAIAGSDAGQAVGRALAPLALRTADLGKASDPDVAKAFSEAVPAEVRTPEQQAALHVIGRQSEIDAVNPYVDTPAARDLHADRLQTALAAIETAGDPDAVAPPLTPRTPVSQSVSRGTAPIVTGDAAVSNLMARIGHVENASGGGNVRNPRSSATGKYQFTDSTWLNYYKRELGAGGLSDAQILAKRADGATQDRLMQSLTQDNARFLHSIGQPETAGNLYLAHFAGTGGARRILEAEAGTPIERVLSAEAIAANPFLRGKTAGDMIEWAHAKMGETPIAGDRVRIAADGGDDAVRLTQQELDSATLEAAAARAPTERADPPIDTAIDAVPHIDPADEIALKTDPVAPSEAAPVSRETADHVPRENVPPAPAASDLQIRDAVRAYVTQTSESLKPEIIAERLGIERSAVKAALAAVADMPGIELRQRRPGVYARIQENAPRDLLRFLADNGGIRDDEGHSLVKGRNLPAIAPTGGVLIKRTGMSIDRARELAAEAGYFHDAPPEDAAAHTSVDDMLQMIEGAVTTPHYARGDLEVAHARAQTRELNTAFAAARESVASRLDAHGLEFTPVEHLRAADLVASGELEPDAAIARVVNEHVQDVLDAAAAMGAQDRYVDLADDFERTLEAGDRGAGAGVDGSRVAGEPAGGKRAGGEELRGAAEDAREEAGLNGPVLAETPGPSLDDPNGPAGKAIAKSLTHDVKAEIDPNIAARDAERAALKAASPMRAAVDQESTIGAPLFDAVDQGNIFRLEDGGPLRSAEDVLRELDADDAAITAARNCL